MITKFDIHELFPNSQTINRKRDITVYHGSKKWFEEFNTKRLGENTFTDLLSLLGFHFTRNYRVAQVFGRSQILTVYLHINKTLKLTEHELVLGMIKYMLGKGYYLGDGLEDFDELSQLPYYMDGFNSTLYDFIN